MKLILVIVYNVAGRLPRDSQRPSANPGSYKLDRNEPSDEGKKKGCC